MQYYTNNPNPMDGWNRVKNIVYVIAFCMLGLAVLPKCTDRANRGDYPSPATATYQNTQQRVKTVQDVWKQEGYKEKAPPVNKTPEKLSGSIKQDKEFDKKLKIATKLHCSIEEAEKLQKGIIWIGMTYEMVKYLRGNPDDINVSNYGNGNQYQACWFEYKPTCVYFNELHEITAYN